MKVVDVFIPQEREITLSFTKNEFALIVAAVSSIRPEKVKEYAGEKDLAVDSNYNKNGSDMRFYRELHDAYDKIR